jgi:hypothetical protein
MYLAVHPCISYILRTSDYPVSHDSVKMLCPVCTHMFQHTDEGTLHTHHENLASFTEAAADGCDFCVPLLEYALKKAGSFEDCLAAPYLYWFSADKGWTDLSLTMLMRKGGEGIRQVRDFVIVPKLQLPINTRVRNGASANPFSEATEAASIWMSNCLNTHAQCQQHTQSESYPTRLLELSDSGARLILSEEVRPVGSYAASSYCWGQNPTFVRLTTENLQDLKAGVLYTDFPIAFREAVRLVRGLSIRYLWIDALCIIQSGDGSSEDWQLECKRMQDVYSNCILNLSLARAAHPEESCFAEYKHDAILPFEVEMTAILEDNKPERHTNSVFHRTYFQEALYNQPLGYRAWVLQERMLATRVLSIGLGELFWDCSQVPHASESLPYGFTNCSPDLRSALENHLGLLLNAVPLKSDNRILQQAWCKIVEEYTMRQLTYPEMDKQVALSAIASRMCHAMDDVYLAGHFLKMLPQSLGWSRDRRDELQNPASRSSRRLTNPSGGATGSRQMKTPTWSWVSMDGPLIRPYALYYNWMPLANVEAYITHRVNENDSKCSMDTILLRICTSCFELEWREGDQDDVTGPTLLWIDSNRWMQLEGVGLIKIILDNPDDQPVNGARYFIAVLSFDVDGRSVHELSRCRDLESLVLRETIIAGTNAYERIGSCTVGIQVDEKWSGMSSEEVSVRLSAYGWDKKVITLC